jgi:hypothetical protein
MKENDVNQYALYRLDLFSKVFRFRFVGRKNFTNFSKQKRVQKYVIASGIAKARSIGIAESILRSREGLSTNALRNPKATITTGIAFTSEAPIAKSAFCFSVGGS